MKIKWDLALSRPNAYMICCWGQAPIRKIIQEYLEFVCVTRPHGHVKTVARSLSGVRSEGESQH